MNVCVRLYYLRESIKLFVYEPKSCFCQPSAAPCILRDRGPFRSRANLRHLDKHYRWRLEQCRPGGFHTRVPGSGDTALITMNGSYSVTAQSSITVASLTLGASAEQQTLGTRGQRQWQVTSTGTVDTNGVLALNGGVVQGDLVINGLVDWTSGQLGSGNNWLSITTSGLVVLAGTNGGTYSMGENFTNSGTLLLQGGNLQIYWCGANYGGLFNLPGGLINMAADVSILQDCGGPGFVNQGILRKSGGTGTNQIYNPFVTTGTVDAQTGTINIIGGSGSGLFSAEAGATMAFASGTFTFNGNLISSNATLSGGNLTGNGTIIGLLNWVAGGLIGNGNNTLNLAANSTLILAGTNGGDYVLSENFVNAGTVVLESGNFGYYLVWRWKLRYFRQFAGGLGGNDGGHFYYW